MQYDIKKIRFSSEQARAAADELNAYDNLVARIQTYLGKLQSITERDLVHQIYVSLSREHIGYNFWNRLQTAALLRQRYAHFRADIIAAVTIERQTADEAKHKPKTVIQYLQEHKQEILDLSAQGMTSKEISQYLHRAYRWQFKMHGSPHFKTVQAALRSFRHP